jgi:DNA-binding XRE family transcriptional regulator
MSKTSNAVDFLPAASQKALQRLGADMALARQRRKESRQTWAQRMNVSIPTLIRMEKGEPTVAIGVYATALWLLGRTNALSTLANPQEDLGALERDVQLANKRYARKTAIGSKEPV